MTPQSRPCLPPIYAVGEEEGADGGGRRGSSLRCGVESHLNYQLYAQRLPAAAVFDSLVSTRCVRMPSPPDCILIHVCLTVRAQVLVHRPVHPTFSTPSPLALSPGCSAC
jgi:hypothetical protein